MRPKNFTLTARQVHRCAAAILQDHLKLPDHGPKCRAGPLLTLLFYAAARLTSLSDACKCLRDAPSDEAARLALIATLPDFAELQRRLNAALAGDLPRPLRRRPQRLAADLVLIPYHGQPLDDPDEIYRSAAKGGTSHFHGVFARVVFGDFSGGGLLLDAIDEDRPLDDLGQQRRSVQRSPTL
jgi:putative transposase